MRRRLLTLGLAVGLGGVASFAFAGPGAERRARASGDEARDPAAGARRIAREASALLAPLVGDAPAPALELLAAERFLALASAAGEADATVFADFERDALVARAGELAGEREGAEPPRGGPRGAGGGGPPRIVEPARARVFVHEAAKLHLRRALGARPAPWLEEGLACCVEDAWEQAADLGAERPDPDRRARARLELRGGARLERLFALDARCFERGERVHRDVALAWAAARHLVQGSARARSALDAYFETLRETRSPERANAALELGHSRAELERALAAGR